MSVFIFICIILMAISVINLIITGINSRIFTSVENIILLCSIIIVFALIDKALYTYIIYGKVRLFMKMSIGELMDAHHRIWHSSNPFPYKTEEEDKILRRRKRIAIFFGIFVCPFIATIILLGIYLLLENIF